MLSTYYRAGMNTRDGQCQPLRLASKRENFLSLCCDVKEYGRGHDWWEEADQTMFLPTLNCNQQLNIP